MKKHLIHFCLRFAERLSAAQEKFRGLVDPDRILVLTACASDIAGYGAVSAASSP